MHSVGVCPNVERCSKAVSGELIDLYPGFGEVCPQCGRRLVPAGEPAPVGASGVQRADVAPPPSPRPAKAFTFRGSDPSETAVAPSPQPPMTPVAAPAPSAQTEQSGERAPAKNSPMIIAVTAGLLVLMGLAFVFFRGGDRAAGGSAPSGSGAAAVAFRICGSSTAMERLVPELARGFLTKAGASKVASGENVVSGVLPRAKQTTRIGLQTMEAASAFTGLDTGTCQIAVAGQEITPTQRVASRTPITQSVLGMDGVVIVVNPANPVAQLSLEQAARIFTGATTNWSALGGADTPIEVVVPSDTNDEMSTFRGAVLRNASVAENARRVDSLAEVSTTVGHDRNAIGVVGFNASDPARVVRLAAADGTPIVASSLNIGQRRYPLTMPIYLYGGALKSNSPAARFIAYAHSDSGQAIVTGANFVGRNSF